MNDKLTVKESTRYKLLKVTVKKHLADARAELLEIRDKRLYREEYETFGEFCEKEFGITRQRGYQLCDAAEVNENIQECQPGLTLPEKSTRAIKDLQKSDQVKVATAAAAKATKEGRNISTKDVKDAREQIAPKSNTKKAPLKAPPPAPEPAATPATEPGPTAPALSADKGTPFYVRDFGVDASKMDEVYGPGFIKETKQRHKAYWLAISMMRHQKLYTPLYATFEEYLASELGLTQIVAPVATLEQPAAKPKVSALSAAQASFERTQATVTTDRLPTFAGRLRLWYQGRTNPYSSGVALGKCDSEVMRKVEELLKEVGV